MDWDDLKIAHAVARHGSLSAAARALGSTQPTVSRRLNALERRLGVKLFEREAGGLTPGPLLTTLLEPLDEMDELAGAVERRIAARDTGLKGTITLTSLAWFGDDVLAPLLAQFCIRHPDVIIDLINDPRRFNLSRREADVAVRVGNFDQGDLVERKVADVSYGLYASETYVRRHGQPDFARKGADQHVVALNPSPIKVVPIEWLKAMLPRAAIVLRTNGVQSHVAALEAGEAMAALPRVIGDRRPGLVRFATPIPEPSQPVKIGVHADLRDTPRIRSVIDFLVQELKLMAPELNPAP
ncbi:LysR family transcriptional regulator [Aestuariivirga sp. YIM B02566]|uniref:LysR family transcriptional regulator n=1 Tax=Taklimakanibacter albus TaxID=2800327 RepID=A0ACC5QZS7_9HYPH|nr:LysR family transcriptional regulator [Aestuariivirga sp. YIM B02566]MBK1865873.1 LysR family transcriptional regulator [Aestuariivirga sp. YIM B02566]